MKTLVQRCVFLVTLIVSGCSQFGPDVSPVLGRPYLYDIVVLTYEGGADGNGLLFLVNPVSGFRTIVSNFGDVTQGPVVHSPFGVAVEASGHILVADRGPEPGGKGGLFRIDPQSKSRTLLSDFANPSQSVTPATPLGFKPTAVAVEMSRSILVVDTGAGTNRRGALFRVDPHFGLRELVSDFGNPAQGPVGGLLSGVTVEADGTILVTNTTVEMRDDFGRCFGAVFRVHPETGMRTPLTFLYSGKTLVCNQGWRPGRAAVRADGIILVTDVNEGVWRVDTKNRSLVQLPASGPATPSRGRYVRLWDIAIEPGGTIVMVDPEYCDALSCPDWPTYAGALLRGNSDNNPLHLTVVTNFRHFLPSENFGKYPFAVAIRPR